MRRPAMTLKLKLAAFERRTMRAMATGALARADRQLPEDSPN